MGQFSKSKSTDRLTYVQTSSLLLERLQAYKHACGYLESYIAETEKVHKAHAKEYEKCLKVGSNTHSRLSNVMLSALRLSLVPSNKAITLIKIWVV